LVNSGRWISTLNSNNFSTFLSNLQKKPIGLFSVAMQIMKARINTEMIRLARDSRGINQAELAESIGILPSHLSKMESNDVGVSEEQLDQISSVTKYPLSFFFQEGQIMPENLAFRKRLKVPQKVLTPITAKINVVRQHVQLLTKALNIAKPELPLLKITEAVTPERAAVKLRQKWLSTDSTAMNIVRVLEDNGVVIASFDFGTERVDSRTIITDNGFPLICYNSSLLGDRQRFSLAFELGQLVMHTNTEVSLDRNIAREANSFAAEFLMPSSEITKDFKDGVSIALLAELKKKWKVSMISLLYRADDLGFVTDNQKRYLVEQFNKLGIRRREPPELDVPIETPKLMKSFIAEYRRKTKSSTAEIAEKLCLYTDEFLQLYA